MGSMITDIATRVHNHNYDIDPIFRSMLDTDFYKLLMAQFIWKKHRHTQATFGLKNRTSTVNLAYDIDYNELENQLMHARSIKLTRGESTWLRGNTFYGERQIFDSEFIDWFEKFQLPEFSISCSNGQYHLEFEGDWLETTMWEIPALSIINELRSRSVMRKFSRFEIDVIYARAKTKLWDKAERLKTLKQEYQFKLSDFGTRRRHSFLWQRWAVQAMQEALGATFIGTSNALLAMQNDLEAIGTNAHELPMVYAALAETHAQLAQSPYEVLMDWQEMYSGNLRIILPDAFGTDNFLRNAPVWAASWKGIRPDSKPWREGTLQAIQYWRIMSQDPKEKLVVLSDGMDIDSIEQSVRMFSDQTNISIGWGTNLTNDFKHCTPGNGDELKAISLVCKVTHANGRPAVKLSDNPAKCMGDADTVERYKRVFNYRQSVAHETVV